MEKMDAFPSSHGEHTSRPDALDQIAELGRTIFGREAFARFLSLPHPIFDGLTPSELVERGEAERVLRALAAEHEGLGY